MKLILKIKVLPLLICLILASTFISAENAPIDWTAAKAGLRELLVGRAQTTPDMKPRVEAWDEASSWSLDLRARALLLKTDNSLAAPERKNILTACKAIAEAILSLETSGDIIKKSGLIKDPAARGWGTV